MSSRPFIAPYQVVASGDMSADITSKVTIIQMVSYISYTLIWSGTPVGNFSVEVSNDYSENPGGTVRNAGTWVPLTFNVAGSSVSTVAAGGAAGTGFFDIDGVAAYAIRLSYAATSGSGTLNAYVNGKVI
jgi:hypothetical protein